VTTTAPEERARAASSVPPPLGYRPSLDGLRAVAVVAVMLFHANVSWAKGGFFGVDIFFVLSGFLITRLLLDEREVTSHTGLGSFYLRRILRLFPALVAVSIACGIYAEVWLPHAEAVRTWHDVFATATYHMNWVQALHLQPAFGLLDHAWSLSIEEQFYVVWPLVLIVAYRIGGVKAVGVVAVLGALGSAVARLALVHTGHPTFRVYYGLDTHADGLLLGCALAALTILWPTMPDALTRRVVRWLGLLALAGVGALIVTTTVGTVRLEEWLYLPFVVLVAIALADLYSGGLTSGLLRHRPLVEIGRISYGLYLWHWPVFLVFNGGRFPWSFATLTAVRLAVSGAVALASFVLIERPFLKLKDRLEPARLARVRARAAELVPPESALSAG
jgi:peptidoglycan/LPS O-acetylase OafA/YrhL